MTMSKADEIDRIISEGGLVFRKARPAPKEQKIRTKAKKKKYITGAHNSGAARQKAKYRFDRAHRTRTHT